MLLLFFGTFFLYLTRKPIEELLRIKRSGKVISGNEKQFFFWLLVIFFIGMLFIAPLIFIYELTGLVLFGILLIFFQVINMVQLKRNMRRTVVRELIGIGGLCLTAPIGYYVGTGKIDNVNFLLWSINFIYFARSVFYVKLRVRASAKRDQLSSWAKNFLYSRNYIYYHSFLLCIIFTLLVLFYKKWLIIAYIPITIQSIIGITRLAKDLNIKKLGYIEVTHSVVFSLLIVVFIH